VRATLSAPEGPHPVPFLREICQLEEQANGAYQPTGGGRIDVLTDLGLASTDGLEAVDELRPVLFADDFVEQPIEKVDLARQGILAALHAARGGSFLCGLDSCDRAFSHARS